MKIIKCLLYVMPDWKGMVWENDYDRIIPNETEKRPIPSKAELENIWAQFGAKMQKDEEDEKNIQGEQGIVLRQMAIDSLKKQGKL